MFVAAMSVITQISFVRHLIVRQSDFECIRNVWMGKIRELFSAGTIQRL
jgi:hypothetical protein